MSGIRGEKWVDIGNAVIARYEAKGNRFEILVDPDKAYEFRKGTEIDIHDVLMGDIIFENIRQGLKASPEKIQEVFGTTDNFKVAEEILRRGELQLTAEQRRTMIEEKKKRIIAILAKNCINPQTGLPHPPQRIERAIEEAKVQIDPWKDAEEQAKYIVKMLQPLIPIRMEQMSLEVTIPPQYSGKAYNAIAKMGNIIKEKWLEDGSLFAVVEIPAGVYNTFIDNINKITKGNSQVKRVRTD
ncbi:MAG: ribosome assembly factor SBDS [Candidatus Odinarchaeia archaeon]